MSSFIVSHVDFVFCSYICWKDCSFPNKRGNFAKNHLALPGMHKILGLILSTEEKKSFVHICEVFFPHPGFQFLWSVCLSFMLVPHWVFWVAGDWIQGLIHVRLVLYPLLYPDLSTKLFQLIQGFFFEPGCPYVVHTAFNLRSFCFWLPGAGITGIYHDASLVVSFEIEDWWSGSSGRMPA
jgi:hypothetical protein